jgi:uncharacterized protein (TIGR03083 family)
MELDEYLPTLEKTNRRFTDVAAEAVLARGWSAHVPGCPGWRLDDLVWHLSEVQHFWAWVVRTRAADTSTYVEPVRHPDDELLGFVAAQNAELETALAGADPHERVWTWAPQQDVAFVLRRQLHEATVHTVDIEQVLGDVRPIPTRIGLDGLDEWLDVIVPGALPHGPPEHAYPVVLHAVDAGVERTLFPGTRAFPVAALTGTAGDLLLAAWRRIPLEVLTVDGDPLQATAMMDLVRFE